MQNKNETIQESQKDVFSGQEAGNEDRSFNSWIRKTCGYEPLWPYAVYFVSFVFSEQLSLLAPSECPHLILQAVAGPMAAVTASTITNPMDVVRARVQVNSDNPQLCVTLKLKAVSQVLCIHELFKTLPPRAVCENTNMPLSVIQIKWISRCQLISAWSL